MGPLCSASPSVSWTSSSTILIHNSHPYWLSCFFSKVSGTLLSQSLCMSYSLCLEQSFSKYPHYTLLLQSCFRLFGKNEPNHFSFLGRMNLTTITFSPSLEFHILLSCFQFSLQHLPSSNRVYNFHFYLSVFPLQKYKVHKKLCGLNSAQHMMVLNRDECSIGDRCSVRME